MSSCKSLGSEPHPRDGTQVYIYIYMRELYPKVSNITAPIRKMSELQMQLGAPLYVRVASIALIRPGGGPAHTEKHMSANGR